MTEAVEHLLLTRFSVKGGWSWETFPDGWLLSRFELFERYCLPSVAAQTGKDFRWLLFCDEITPEWALERLRGYRQSCEQLEVWITTAKHHMVPVVNDLLAEDTTIVATTRIDSDDAMHRDMVAVVKEYVEPFAATGEPTWLLNFCSGVKYDVRSGLAHASHLDNSPFHTLFERRPPAQIKTVLSGNHSRMHETYRTHQDLSLRAWLEVIHGGNVRNAINYRDTPLPGADLVSMFNIVEGDPGELWSELPPSARR